MSDLRRVVDVHKALGHPVRLRIVGMLRGGELFVCQMTAVLELAASTVSAHLAELKRAGLLTERKQGRWVSYRLAESPETRAFLEPAVKAIVGDPRLQADARLLRELRRISVQKLCRVDLDLGRLGISRPLAGA